MEKKKIRFKQDGSCLVRPGPVLYLQDVMQQGNAALVGLGLRELQQRANLETHSIPSVAPLESTPMIHFAGFGQKISSSKV